MDLTFFFNARDTSPLNANIGWEALCDLLEFTSRCEWRRSRKLDFPAMIFGLCEGRRANANIRHLSGLAADFDIGPDDPRYIGFDDMCDRMEREGYAFAAYTTTKNDGAHNHFRLVMPYAEDVPVQHCEAAWHASNAKFGDAIDASTKDPARLSFLPADWCQNPFADSKGLVTLRDPFNALRVNVTGKPILSASEIAGLVTLTAPAGAPKGKPRTYCVTPVLSARERASLAKGKALDDVAWRLLGDLNGPLVAPWLRDELPLDPGNRDHRFMCAVASKAIRNNLPITTDIIVSLVAQFSRGLLHREPPHDAARQAENALAWAFRNAAEAAPSQPGAGT